MQDKLTQAQARIAELEAQVAELTPESGCVMWRGSRVKAGRIRTALNHFAETSTEDTEFVLAEHDDLATEFRALINMGKLEPELKPCPSCGGEWKLYNSGDTAWAGICENCDIETQVFESREHTVAACNRRPEDSA